MGERPLTHGEITITEGKKHQVKKMIAAVGGYVVYLERVAIGDLHIDESLARGEYRAITDDELDLIVKDR
jgi:16S rRNA pseudouridine516 synthase